MYISDQELLARLYEWQKESLLSASKLCQKLDINKNTFSNWKKGRPISIKKRKAILALLYPETEKENDVEKPEEKIQTYPVISEAAAATVNTLYLPACEYAREYAEDFVSFSKGREGDFVIKVVGDSMAPWYPSGTLLLVRPNAFLQNGDRVIAVLADGAVLFKLFAQDETNFYLMSENLKDGKDYKFAKNDFNGVRAMYLVIQSMRDEQALDAAKREQGIPFEWMERMKSLQ